MAKTLDIETLRYNIDEAVNAWQLANGLTQAQIDDMDYSDLDNELNYLLGAEE